MGMRGDVKSFREMVEKVQGRKFFIRENSIEEMEKKAGDAGKVFYTQVRIDIARDGVMSRMT